MKYAVITNDKRSSLLQRVLVEKQPIKIVAQQLKIKFPSAKSIIRTYKKTGRVFNKKKVKKDRRELQQQRETRRYKKSTLQQKNQNGINDQQDQQQKPAIDQVKCRLMEEKPKQIPIETYQTINSLQNIPEVSQIAYDPAMHSYYTFVSAYVYSPYAQYPPLPMNQHFSFE